MCPCADNTEKLNGGNVTEQTDRSPVPTLVDSQSDQLKWDTSREQSKLVYYRLQHFQNCFVYILSTHTLNIGMQTLLRRYKDTDLTWLPSCSHWTCLTENVGFHLLTLPDFLTPTRQDTDLLPRLFFTFSFFASSETLEVSSGYICLWRDLIHYYTAMFPFLLMFCSSRTPSLSLFLWVTRDKNLQWCWRKYNMWRARLQQRDTYLEGVHHRFKGREGRKSWYTASLLMLVFGQKN